MFTIHILGLGVLVNEDSGLSALLLNSATSTKLPLHVPSIFATRNALKKNGLAPLGGVRYRWASGTHSPDDLIGWDITGLHIRVGTKGPVEGRVKATPDQPRYPKKLKGKDYDWTDLHWVLDAKKMFPTGELIPAYRKVGDQTNAIVEFHGGRQQGGKPWGVGGSLYEWTVRPGYTQGFTDTLDVVYETAPPPFKAYDCDGRHVGTLEFALEGEVWIVNEAPQRATTLNQKIKAYVGSDSLIYQDVFATKTKAEKKQVIFKRGAKKVPIAPTGESCNMCRLELRSEV